MQCQIRLLKKTSIPKVQRQCIQNMTGIVKVQWSEEQIRLKLKERVLQFTCGGGNQKSLVEMCAKKRYESFYPTKERNSLQNYFYGLKLLLSQK